MAHPYYYPDPGDRSPNTPTVIISRKKILGLYNQYNSKKKKYVSKKVRKWFLEQAYRHGWSQAQFIGPNEVILHKDFAQSAAS